MLQVGGGACSNRRCDDGWVDGDGEELLAGEVEGEVLVGLEEAEFADLLGGDAGGGEVGDAAGVELEADVGDVGLAGEDGQADGADFTDGRIAGEGEDDVEVVDHEVEDDVDVERARGEKAEPVGLEEHGLVEGGEGGGDGRVEALEVADGEDAVVVLGEAVRWSASARVAAKGFSMRTSTPAWSKGSETAAWWRVGTQMEAASRWRLAARMPGTEAKAGML